MGQIGKPERIVRRERVPAEKPNTVPVKTPAKEPAKVPTPSK